MASLFDRFRGRKEPSSAEIAKERLQLVLVTDRSNLSPEKLESMQREIIEVIKRYIPIDAMEVQINIEQRQRKHYLVADVPLNRDPNYGAIDAPAETADAASANNDSRDADQNAHKPDADSHDAESHDSDSHDANSHDADSLDADSQDADRHDADRHDADNRASGSSAETGDASAKKPPAGS